MATRRTHKRQAVAIAIRKEHERTARALAILRRVVRDDLPRLRALGQRLAALRSDAVW
jgi:hypothetical protein